MSVTGHTKSALAVELTRFAERLAGESRSMLLGAAGKRPKIDIKPDASFVTETDRAIETRLRDLIEQTYPDHGILGEEYGSRDLDAEFVWVLDPIDGTAPFIAGIPVYGTLIGLAYGGAPWIGVIDHPATDDRWVGVSGDISRHNGTVIRTQHCTNLDIAILPIRVRIFSARTNTGHLPACGKPSATPNMVAVVLLMACWPAAGQILPSTVGLIRSTSLLPPPLLPAPAAS